MRRRRPLAVAAPQALTVHGGRVEIAWPIGYRERAPSSVDMFLTSYSGP